MINAHTLQGNWNEIKGKLLSKWSSLTEDDLTVFDGNVEQLVGLVQRTTGEARECIERFFSQCSSEEAAAVCRAGETVRAYAQQATESVHQTSKQAADAVREGYADVEKMVQQRPAESLAVCFGVGVITGVVVALLCRTR